MELGKPYLPCLVDEAERLCTGIQQCKLLVYLQTENKDSLMYLIVVSSTIYCSQSCTSRSVNNLCENLFIPTVTGNIFIVVSRLHVISSVSFPLNLVLQRRCYIILGEGLLMLVYQCRKFTRTKNP